MAASAIINWIGSPDYAKTGDEFSIRCQAQNTGDVACYLHIKLYDADTNELLYDYGKYGLINPGGTLNPFPGTYPIEDLVTMPDHDWNLIAHVWIDDWMLPDGELSATIINGVTPLSIASYTAPPELKTGDPVNITVDVANTNDTAQVATLVLRDEWGALHDTIQKTIAANDIETDIPLSTTMTSADMNLTLYLYREE